MHNHQQRLAVKLNDDYSSAGVWEKRDLKIDELLRLQGILESTGLSRPEKFFRPNKSNFDRLVSLFAAVDERDRDIVFDLIPYYDIVCQYRNFLYSLLQRITTSHQGKICLFPLIDIHESKVKSGEHVFYELRSLANPDFEDRVVFYDSPDSEKLLKSNLPKYAVDDFIGTGEQFLEMIDHMAALDPAVSVAGVLTIVVMEAGKVAIESKGMNVVYEILKRKAIDGYIRDEGRDIDLFYARYDALESQLAVMPDHVRGWHGSEALISMKRTPDNTLPIFWHKGKDRQWPAPFPR